MKIFLIGYMGSGKSTLGEKLAKKLAAEFIDLDRLISKQKGKSIADIFNSEGEKKFRIYEKQALRSLGEKEDVVVATGGGTPCFYNNIDWMNASGLTIFLDISLDALMKRLTRNPKTLNRPLLKDKSPEELKNHIKASWQKRLPYYRKAKYTILSDDAKVAHVLPLLGAEF